MSDPKNSNVTDIPQDYWSNYECIKRNGYLLWECIQRELRVMDKRSSFESSEMARDRHMSPKMPANVFFRLLIVSSAGLLDGGC